VARLGREVILSGGAWLGGVCYRQAHIRPLVGADEAFLGELGERLRPAEEATALLARTVSGLGPAGADPAEVVRALSVGDREALLLELRRLTRGDRLDCVVECPATDCRERLDITLRVADLILPARPRSDERYERVVHENGTEYRAVFRLPTGADQEAACTLPDKDPRARALHLLRQCVERAMTAEGRVVNDLPPLAAAELARRMAELDPQAELQLEITCPECGGHFVALFDAAAFLLEELAAERRMLYREVHALALHYHWSEAEIMAMTRHKRRLYLNLLDEALGEEPGV
jgi:hypothetical protein